MTHTHQSRGVYVSDAKATTACQTWTADKRWRICLTENKATLHECGPHPLLAFWIHWTLDPCLRATGGTSLLLTFFSLGVIGLVQSTDCNHTIVALETNVSCFWLSGAFTVWQWYTFYCKSHSTMGYWPRYLEDFPCSLLSTDIWYSWVLEQSPQKSTQKDLLLYIPHPLLVHMLQY